MQGELFPGREFEEEPRIEALGERPAFTRDEFIGFCDRIHEYDPDTAAVMFDRFGDQDTVDVGVLFNWFSSGA